MSLASSSIHSSMGNNPQLGDIFLYQLLAQEIGTLSESISAVVDKNRESYKRSNRKMSSGVINQPTFISEVCTFMRDALTKQLQREYNTQNIAQHRKKVFGGGNRATKKRVMKQRNRKTLQNRRSSKRM